MCFSILLVYFSVVKCQLFEYSDRFSHRKTKIPNAIDVMFPSSTRKPCPRCRKYNPDYIGVLLDYMF